MAGFARVFCADQSGIDKATEAVYKQARCGFAHDGMFRHKVFFRRSGCKPLFVTFPKKPDGQLDLEAEVPSIVINPRLLFERIVRHFEHYIREIRKQENIDVRRAFETAFRRQRGVGEKDPVIGMTEAEFFAKT